MVELLGRRTRKGPALAEIPRGVVLRHRVLDFARLLLVAVLIGTGSSSLAQTAQTITFAALAGKTYGNPPFTVTATASSGLPVSFASTTTSICTVSGATVTIVTGGSCTIRASQAGNATYAPAPNVDRSFTVAKANQTITFGALAGQTFGAAPFTVSAAAFFFFGYSYL